MAYWGYLVFSFILVAFGQSAWISYFSLGAAAFGFALFWRSMLMLPKKRDRFFLSWGWFSAVQAVQISWLASTDYMGPLILLVYVFLAIALGVQFGVISLFFEERGISLRSCFAIAGSWVLMEWIRLFFFTGFPWNPVGLALADSSYAIQWASIFGVYGLSFWVILVNAVAVGASWKRGVLWLVLAATPYLFGWAYPKWMDRHVPIERMFSAALVQTALLPEEKDLFTHRSDRFVPPLNQWERIWENLRMESSLDLIVLPEAAVSFSAHYPFYPLEIVEEVWIQRFGKESLFDLPALEPPLARLEKSNGQRNWKVSNAFLAQATANHFKAHLIAGFDDQEEGRKYNAAFEFLPQSSDFQRYEKRVLVPVGEYIPFSNIRWLAAFLSEQFGIGDSFDTGNEAKLFSSPLPIGVSICLEETYSDLIRDLRLNGARLFVNVTNDVWFPRSRLPKQHFQHSRIRAVENGVYVLRSCNTGITAGIDCFGRVIAALPPSETDRGILYLTFPLKSLSTLYTWWGDKTILCLSFFFIFLGFRKKKLLLNGSLR